MKIRILLLIAYSIFLSPHALAQSDTAATNFWKNLPQGPQVYGYYEGRTPCQELSQLLGAQKSEDCIKIKWQLILFRDPITKAPTTYALGGLLWRHPPKTGPWTLRQGAPHDPTATIIQLDPEAPKPLLSFLQADENILFFLDPQHRLLIGNEDFSFTLNRIAQK